MRKEYFGILLAVGALMACKKVAKQLIGEEEPAVSTLTTPGVVTSGAAAAAAAAASAANAPNSAVASAAPAAVESVAPAAATPFDGKYPLDGIRQIPSNCKAPLVILTSVTRQVMDSDKFPWNFAKQVFVANPQFKASPFGPPKAAADVFLHGAEHKPTNGVALIAECASADTCMQVAAAYKIVVPTSKPEVVCGKAPTLGEGWATIVIGPDEPLKERLPPKDNIIQQCVRLAACQARKDGKLDGDPAIECQRKPSSFQLRCSFKESCDDVISCVGQSAHGASAANGSEGAPKAQ